MKEKKYFTIGEAAKSTHTTSETLRHYDRIGLVKPSMKDAWTNYRYYAKQDIIRINTVKALQCMDLSLKEIQDVLSCDNLEDIVSFLTEAEKKADEKIALLKTSKERIKRAKADYSAKLENKELIENFKIREIPERVILLSDSLATPTVDNLWNYLSHFYDKLDPDLKNKFHFEDKAGIYTEGEKSRLFAICLRHTDIEGIKRLPSGRYLCADCSDEDKERTIEKLLDTARKQYDANPGFIVQQIIVTGILQWIYEIQIYIGRL